MSTVFTDEIQNQDVLFGRSKVSVSHIGNEAFRTLIDVTLDLYFASESSRGYRSSIVDQVTQAIILVGGRFLKSNGGSTWTEVDQKIARTKVGHAFRDAWKARLSISSSSKKSNAAKHRTHVHGDLPPRKKSLNRSTFTSVASFSEILSDISEKKFGTSSNPPQQKALEASVQQRMEHAHTRLVNDARATIMFNKQNVSQLPQQQHRPIYIACRGPPSEERSVCNDCALHFAPVLTCFCSCARDVHMFIRTDVANDNPFAVDDLVHTTTSPRK